MVYAVKAGVDKGRDGEVEVCGAVYAAEFPVVGREGGAGEAAAKGTFTVFGAVDDVGAAGPGAVCEAGVGGESGEGKGGEGGEVGEEAGDEGGFAGFKLGGGGEGVEGGGVEGEVNVGSGAGLVGVGLGVEGGAEAVAFGTGADDETGVVEGVNGGEAG